MKNDSMVKCGECGRTEKCDFGYCLGHGWPECHGRTMSLIAQPSPERVGDVVRDTLTGAVMVMDAARRARGSE